MAISIEMGLVDGAILTVVGMGIVFARLPILARLSRAFAERGQKPVAAMEEKPSIVFEVGEEPPPGEVVAVIALALSLVQAESGRPAPRKEAPPAPQPSLWAVYGRQQIMNSRGRTR